VATYLDFHQGPRRDAFRHFVAFEQPYFSLCTRMDVAPLKAALARHPGPGGLSLACHHIALALANRHEAFRLRLEGQGAQARVRLHARVDGSATVLRADDSFGFAYLPYLPRFADFRLQGAAAVQAVRDGPPGFHEPPSGLADEDATPMYFTTLPWVHFSSFAHARPGGGVDDSIPRVAFGRIDAEGARQWLPVALDVHHALMDGVHAGRWLQALEAAFAAPEDWLA
jgi:chloramphenicol O-acetyltransferase type A